MIHKLTRTLAMTADQIMYLQQEHQRYCLQVQMHPRAIIPCFLDLLHVNDRCVGEWDQWQNCD